MASVTRPAMPTTSIVITNYNGGSLLGDCVESIRRHSQDYQIIIVDNRSIDNSISSVRPDADLFLIRLPQNLGFARATNLGIRACVGQYIVLLNSDTVVTPRWLDKLIETAESAPSIGIVTPKLLRPGSSIIDSTGHLFQYQTATCRDRGQGQMDLGQFDSLTELVSSSFPCALMKREMIDAVGLLDEKMFFYFEDVDYCLRARLSGWRVVFCPQSIVYHARGGSTSSRDKARINNLSRGYPLRVMLKNYQLKNTIHFGGQCFLRLLISSFAGVKNSDWHYARSNLRSAAWNLAHIPVRERVLIQIQRKLADKWLFRLHGSGHNPGLTPEATF